MHEKNVETIPIRSADAIQTMQTENIAKALDLKEKGNQAFKNGDYKVAMTAYHEIYMFVHGFSEGSSGAMLPGQTTKPVSSEEMAQIHELKLAHFSNLAMCHMKIGNTPKALANCSKALAIDPKNVKALFRRGKCYAELGALDESKADLDRLLQLDPGNKDAMRELRMLKTRFASHRKKEQKKFAGMFDKLNAEEGEGTGGGSADTMDAKAIDPAPADAGAGQQQVRIISEDGCHRVAINGSRGTKRVPSEEAAAAVTDAAVTDAGGEDDEDDIGEPLDAPQAFEPSDVVVH